MDRQVRQRAGRYTIRSKVDMRGNLIFTVREGDREAEFGARGAQDGGFFFNGAGCGVVRQTVTDNDMTYIVDRAFQWLGEDSE